MGEDVVREKDFTCPCGKGVLRVQVVEHDVYSSGRHSRWRLECAGCAPKYRELISASSLISREHDEEIRHREHAIHEMKMAVGDKAVERYLDRYAQYIKAMKFKSAMHAAIGSHTSITKFRDEARHESGLDDAIRVGLKRDPERALQQLKIQDVDIEAELATITQEKVSLKEFVEKVPKHPIPNIDD